MNRPEWASGPEWEGWDFQYRPVSVELGRGGYRATRDYWCCWRDKEGLRASIESPEGGVCQWSVEAVDGKWFNFEAEGFAPEAEVARRITEAIMREVKP